MLLPGALKADSRRMSKVTKNPNLLNSRLPRNRFGASHLAIGGPRT
jgi:hypothetical protein